MSGIVARKLTVEGRDRPRLKDVDLQLLPGHVVVVLGPNGAGKTTLLRALLGRVEAAGEVALNGQPLSTLGFEERAARLAWLPQAQRLEEGLTATEVVLAARFRFKESRAHAATAAAAALTEAGGADLADHPMETLSGGEVQRVRMATLIAQAADFWLLDEPGNHLDPALQLSLYESLVAQVRDGRGLILVTHDLVRLPFLADAGVPVQVLCLQAGEVVLRTSLDDPDLPKKLGDVFGLDLQAVDLDGRRRLVIGGRQ